MMANVLNDPGSGHSLRFGIICSGTTLEAWQVRCLEKLLDIDGVIPVLLLVDGSQNENNGSAHRLVSSQDQSVLWRWYEHRLLARSSLSMSPVDMNSALGHLPAINCRTDHTNERMLRLSTDALNEIRSYNLDFVLQFTSSRLQGDILSIPRYGVWSFHHGDPDKFRGQPAGFWEIVKGDPVTGAVLQRCVDGQETGVILRRGYFKTFGRSYARSRDNALFGSSDWPQQVCADIKRGSADYIDGAPSATKAPNYRYPNNREMLRFGFVSARAWIRNTVEWLFQQQQWSVGIVDAPIHKILDLTGSRQSGVVSGVRPENVRWLPEIKGLFLADPFAVAHRNGSSSGMTILAEEYPWKQRRGRISIMESADGKTFQNLEPVIELPCHMSYPFLFEYEGDTYCIPETFEPREVSLFRAGRSLRDWTKIATLIKNFPAVDSTVFRHDGRWWLLCTSQEAGPNSTLFGWYADELTGPWTPHPANPLKIDIRSGRPAGTPFVHNGELYRPAQDCSTGYGAAVVINRIRALSPSEFSEETVAVLKPDPQGPYPAGLHTICVLPECTIIDGARRTLVPQVFADLVLRKVRRLMGKLRKHTQSARALS